MSSVRSFPLPFTSLGSLPSSTTGSWVVGAMYTASYEEKARSLAASCERFGLPHAIHHVPAVHRSINSRGTPDPAFTKANFIHHLLSTHKKPVLYVDADCEFLSEPALLEGLVRSGTDIAVYNWLADEHTDAFAPVEIALPNQPPSKNRFYTFTHSVEHFAPNQLLCSGPVQYYGVTEGARLLLAEWFRTIIEFPGTADDECLDFAFNNLGARTAYLRPRWLPKAYARYAWWIYAKPVINHPDPPNTENNFVQISDPAGRQRFYPAKTEKRDAVRLFPRDCIIDTEQRMVCRMIGNRLVAISPTDQNFWL
jgi:hypothetical protein